MVRINPKRQVISYENSIQKSREFSMAKLSQGLTLNQMQLLAFAIYSTQQNGATEFHKADFEKKFGIEKYQTIHAKQDVQKVSGLKFSIEDLENHYFEYWNIFGSIKYKEGLFTFRWNEEFIPHILELKEKYITSDLTITSQFKSGFSWTLYDYLKAHHGYWHKQISKEGLMKLFGVEKVKTYLGVLGYKLPLPFSILPFIRHSKYPEKSPQTVQHENRPSRHDEHEQTLAFVYSQKVSQKLSSDNCL